MMKKRHKLSGFVALAAMAMAGAWMGEAAFAHSGTQNWGTCSTPTMTTGIYEEANPTFSTSSVSYEVHEHWTETTGKPPNEVTTEKSGWSSATASCTVTAVKTDGRYSKGVDTYKVTASHPSGTDASATYYVYWVKQADVWLTQSGGTYNNGVSGTTATSAATDTKVNGSGLTTYDDQDMPQIKCVKTYGDNTQKPCEANVTVASDAAKGGKKGVRETCYRYADTHTKDGDKICTVRVYTQSVDITSGTEKSYTGEHYAFTCEATFADGTKRDVSLLNEDFVWLSYPAGEDMKTFRDGRYIGTQWVRSGGYQDPSGEKHAPDSLHDFYPVDSESKTYQVNCTYYPGKEWVNAHYDSFDIGRVVQKNTLISDYDLEGASAWHVPRHDTQAVKHIGIQAIGLEATGGFQTAPNQYEVKTLLPGSSAPSGYAGEWNLTDEVNNKDYAPQYWNQHKFVTGHWYDFRAIVTFNDGRKKDITSAEEVYWDSTPWFDGQKKHIVENLYDSGMSKTGLDHRIAGDGWNTISVEYFHKGVPCGETEVGRTKAVGRLFAHQIQKLEIKDAANYSTPPKTVFAENEIKTGNYAAWVTFSDGEKENWTNAVMWYGDYLTARGKADFSPMKGKEQKTTLFAAYHDRADLSGEAARVAQNGTLKLHYWRSGKENWDAVYDGKEITVTNCQNVTHLAWQCDLPDNYWRTNPFAFFDPLNDYSGEKNRNFAPPPGAFNYNSWTEENDLYTFIKTFPVSGTSTGTGNQ